MCYSIIYFIFYFLMNWMIQTQPGHLIIIIIIIIISLQDGSFFSFLSSSFLSTLNYYSHGMWPNEVYFPA